MNFGDRWHLLLSLRVIKFFSANGTLFAPTFNKLNYTEPVESMVAWKFSCLSHVFLANSTFFMLTLIVFDEGVVLVNIVEEASELEELFNVSVKVFEELISVLDEEKRRHGE
jgi:ABC-type antimicrobial peptide transport system permease subunit